MQSTVVNAGAYNGTRVLVTGATGFIGAHLMGQLAQAGATVIGTARSPARNALEGCAEFVNAELSDFDSCRALLDAARPDHVFHLAGQVSGRQGLVEVMATLHSILMSTVNLLTLIAQGSARPRSIVIAGTSEEPRSFSLSDVTTAPTSPYAAAKLSGAAYIGLFRLTYGLPVSHARLFMTYGPAQRDLKKIVPYVTLELLRGNVPKLASGRRRGDWIYAGDAASALMVLGLRPDIASVDIGSGQLTSMAELAGRLRDLVDPTREIAIGALADRTHENERFADVAETERLLGWRPVVTMDEGLRRTIDWYRRALPNLS